MFYSHVLPCGVWWLSYLLLSLSKPLVLAALASRDLAACEKWPGNPWYYRHVHFNVGYFCMRSQSRLWRPWSAPRANHYSCAQDFVSVSMAFMSLLYVFSQVTSIYPEPTDGTLLQRHGEHEGLDCAFGFAPIACAAGGNTFGKSGTRVGRCLQASACCRLK